MVEIAGTIISFIVLMITIVGISVKQNSRISVLETKSDNTTESVKRIDSDLKIHEALNANMVLKTEEKLEAINQNIYKILGYLEAKDKK